MASQWPVLIRLSGCLGVADVAPSQHQQQQQPVRCGPEVQTVIWLDFFFLSIRNISDTVRSDTVRSEESGYLHVWMSSIFIVYT